ncbi:MAG: type II secretion system protein N [Desulforhopalus sp.]|jgi:type II secretion system protein N
MMQAKSSSRLFFYIVYGIVLTLVLLYLRFPTTEFKTYCEQQIEHALNNNTTCSIEQIRYKFPFSVTLEQLKLQKTTGGQQPIIMIDKIGIRPALKFWSTFKIAGTLYSGSLQSTLKINRDESSYKLTDLVLHDLNLGAILKDQGIANREIQGSLSGSGIYQADWASATKGKGKARIALSKGSFELLVPVLSLSAINFEQINFDLSLTEQTELQQGKLKGRDINANFEGSVNIMNSFQDSRIVLSGLLEPKREFLQTHPLEAKMVKQYAKRFRKNGLPFKMGGTLSNPTFRFSR